MVEATGARWDAVFVDEAQDFTEENWLLVQALAGKGRLWAFQDPAQAFWEERTVPEELFTSYYKLTRSYRSPPELMRVATEIVKFRGEGLEPQEIAVISLRGVGAKGSVLDSQALR